MSTSSARGSGCCAGIQAGWSFIDCGCGPIGGLAVLSEMVGPQGRVVGVDFAEAAVARARAGGSSRTSRCARQRRGHIEPPIGFALHAATLAAAKEYQWVGSSTFFDLAFRKPSD